jgi:uncharacterized cupin superfamily protein
MIQEARLERHESGLVPVDDGWFVLNAADAVWDDHPVMGSGGSTENPERRFTGVGYHIHVLLPGQPNGMYHHESMQEDFLVLAGECILVIEEQERRLKAWDFVHCPPGTNHIFIGAGEEPCVIFMTSPRVEHTIHYPVSEVAAKHGASVSTPTDFPREAYAQFSDEELRRPSYWDKLPWAK